MKKLLAILLAALMALTGTLALAEAGDALPETEQAPGMTVTCEFDVDREVLANALTALGVPEELHGLADTIAAVLTEAGERLIVCDDGVEYALTLKGADVVNLVAQKNDEGLVLASSLIPSYVLTLSNETMLLLVQQLTEQMSASMGSIDFDALSEAVQGYCEEYLASCTAAVTNGEPEMGDYVMDGISYNTMIPIEVDIPAVMEAANKLVKQLNEDENVQAVLQALQAMGVNFSLEGAEAVADEELPTMTMEAYMTLDEQGDAGDTTLVVFDVYAPGAAEGDDPVTVGDVLVQGEAVTVNVQLVSAENTQVSVSYLPADESREVRVDVYAPNDLYFGCDVIAVEGDTTVVDTDVFVLDTEKPLLSEHAEIAPSGELTLSADAEGKTAIAIEDLMGEGEESEEALGSLIGDLLSNGLGGAIGAALEAMPEEISALGSLFSFATEEAEDEAQAS